MPIHACRHVAADEVVDLPRFTEVTVDVPCNPNQLFDVFEDAASWPKWTTVIRDVRWQTPPPIQEGSIRTVKMAGMFAEELFTAYERGRRMAFCFTQFDQPTLSAFAEDWIVLPNADGGSHVIWRVGMEPTGIGRYTTALSRPFMRPGLQVMLMRLRRYVARTTAMPEVTV